MSSDAITYASRQMTLMSDTLDGMVEKYPEPGQSYQETIDAIQVMMALWGRSAAVVSRYVGGVYVDRAMVGQPGATDPFRPVELARQREAMKVLGEQVFSPNAFDLSEDLLRHAAPQRRGFAHYGATEDPKVHDAVLNIQKAALDHLLNPTVMRRMTDSALYGNEYSLGEMIDDLTDSIFAADARRTINSYRQNLQMEYVQRLAKVAAQAKSGNGEYHTPAVSMAVYSLDRVRDMIDANRSDDVMARAHIRNLNLVIGRALSAEA